MRLERIVEAVRGAYESVFQRKKVHYPNRKVIEFPNQPKSQPEEKLDSITKLAPPQGF